MSKKTAVLLTTLAGVTVSAGIVVGATYALFTGRTEVNAHLKAGNLKIGLSRTSYTQYVPNETGLLAEVADVAAIDLAEEAAPVFYVEQAIPGCWYQAEVTVSNDGAVAFDYGMRILWDEAQASEAEKLFAEQIIITVFYGEEQQKSFPLNECKEVENEAALGVLYKGATDSFTVKAAFVEDENNDAVQGVAIQFDLQVFATQYVDE